MKTMNELIFLQETVVRSVTIDKVALAGVLTDISSAEVTISHDKGNDITFWIVSNTISDRTMIKFLKSFDRYRPLCKEFYVSQFVTFAKDLAAEVFDIRSYDDDLKDAEDVSRYLQLPHEYKQYALKWKKSSAPSPKIIKYLDQLTTEDKKLDEVYLQIIKDLASEEFECRWLNLSISTNLFSREVSITKFRDKLLAIELTGAQNAPKASLHYSVEEYQSQLARVLIRLYGKDRLIDKGIIEEL